ncbi:hypothetical protein GKQ23_18945 [Erwinia sp. E602]|uniref:hypothetical protein n=1 Tax=unclassified Erwinia TaxID=2622719 RepID=UPI0006F37635|nr:MULTISPECIES: hypothetical protein [unclassified Erwinia]KQN63066.1 hypothetical protein ASF13_20630 [Erwinia sp. Leaf53]PLV61223.1 hypothetical protein NV64_10155 [Erwinia sp. B116]QUG76941.1 hypothetical protein GKQ23_18945 [Erwinia sp. E602]
MADRRDSFSVLRAALLSPLLALPLAGYIPALYAEKITIALSQEQDGGPAGRACIYVHQGKAEYRLVKAGETCAAEIVVESHQS